MRLEHDPDAAGRLYAEALAMFREHGNSWGVNIMLQNRAQLAPSREEYDQAWALFAESLATSQELDDRLGIIGGLIGLGGVQAARQQPAAAARFFGAAEALRTSIGAHIQAADRTHYEHVVAAARSQLDAAAFEAAWAEGRRMSLGAALTLAHQV
jgi:hypothetical protein